MIRPYVYVSCPMSVGQDILNEVEKVIQDEHLFPGWQVKSWKRGTQYEESIRSDAKIMVVILSQRLDWGKSRSEISTGSYKEICAAYKEKQPIFLAYRKASGEIKFYQTDIDFNAAGEVINIRGIENTSNDFFFNICDANEELSEEGWDYDAGQQRWMHEDGYDEYDNEDEFLEEVYIPDFAEAKDLADIIAKWDADEPFKQSQATSKFDKDESDPWGKANTSSAKPSGDVWMKTGMIFFDPAQKEEKSLEINKPLLIGRLR